MAKNKEAVSKGSKFGRGMLIYAIVFLIIAAGVLAWFYTKMAAYERSRPNYVIEKYISQIDSAKVKALSEEFISDISPDIQSEDECYQLIVKMIKESGYVKNIKDCTDYRLSYYLKYEGTLIENLVLTLGKEDRFGYIPWAIESERILGENLVNEKTLVLDPGCKVSVGGKDLDKTHIVDNNTPIQLLKDFYSRYDSLPHYETWNTGKYLTDLPIEIISSSGEIIDVSETGASEYEDNCTASEKEEINTLMNKYIEKYVAFTSGTNNNPYSNYYECSQYVIYGSELQQRLHDAIGGLGFASSLGDHIDSITVNRCMKIGDDLYAADVTYVVTTTGSNGMVSTNDYNGIYILSRDEDGDLLAENETTY